MGTRRFQTYLVAVSTTLTFGVTGLGETALPVGTVANRDLTIDQAMGVLDGAGVNGDVVPPTGESTLPGGGEGGGGGPALDPFLDTGSASTGSGGGTSTTGQDFAASHTALHEQLLATLNAFLSGQLDARTALETAFAAAHAAFHDAYDALAEGLR